MEQLGATLALTSRRYEHLWEDRMKVCVVDEDSIAKLPVARAPPAVGIRPSNLLYIIFTSGSTGTPKGVVVEHESFLTAAAQHVKASNMTASSRVLQMTPYTFDVSMLEIFTTLTTGACVCFPGDELAQKGISAIINGLGITWTFMTPSLIRLVDPADVPTLQTLALGGEALGRIDVTTWAERLQLINGKAFAGNYEATECGADD
jgi:non-ribosomal peptide synthetase component F